MTNSILKKFGLEASQGLELLDHHLQSDYQSIVVILLDGMGKCIMDRNLEKDGFFHKHLLGTYSSVFPPTTVAAHNWFSTLRTLLTRLELLLFTD